MKHDTHADEEACPPLILLRHADIWTARFWGIAGIPETEDILLPFNRSAQLIEVAVDLAMSFPGASLVLDFDYR